MRTRALIAMFFAALGAASASAAEPACKTSGALGVARTVEIDTTGGPRYGAPFGDANLLQPGEVVLTFDDGPAPRSTKPILDALAAQCTQATFFVLGEMVAAHPDTLREMVAQGHTIGTHTWSHVNIKRQSDERMKVQIESTINEVEKVAPGAIAPFFRYPYLSESEAAERYLRSRDIAQFAIDVDSLDWRYRNSKSVVARIMRGLAQRGRGIVLLHDIHPSTAAAIPELLARLKEGGYRIVHLRPKSPPVLIASIGPPTKVVERRQVARISSPPRSRHRVAGAPYASKPSWNPFFW